MGVWSDLIGTIKNKFKIGLSKPATLDASGLTAARNFVLPDAAGTFTVQGDIVTFVASGSSHAGGLVPDPGGSAGSTNFLCEDATWAVPSGGGSPGGSDGQFQFNNAGAFAGNPHLLIMSNGFKFDDGTGADIMHWYLASGTNPTIEIGRPGHRVSWSWDMNGGQTYALDEAGNVLFSINHASAGISWFGAAFVGQQAANQALTDSTGGSASTTLAAVSGSGDDGPINNNFASLAARLAEIRTLLTNYGLGS